MTTAPAADGDATAEFNIVVAGMTATLAAAHLGASP